MEKELAHADNSVAAEARRGRIIELFVGEEILQYERERAKSGHAVLEFVDACRHSEAIYIVNAKIHVDRAYR